MIINQNHTEVSNFLLASLVGSVVAVGVVLSLPSALAETDSSDIVTVVVPSSCSVGSTIATGSEHSTDIRNGIYKPDIGETTITTFCNDNEGYSVYAIGFSDDTLGKTVLSSSLDDSYDIATGTATGPVGNDDVSNWAMKLTAVSGTFTPTILDTYDAYHAVPSSYAKVATFPSQTDTIEGSSIKTTYAVYASKNQVADTYTGKVKYTVLHPASEPAPTIPTAIEQAYANAGKEKYNGYYKMQDMSSSICNAVNVYDDETQTQVIDVRDDKVYWIAKLRDGHCWMTQNLDLELETTPTNVATLTSANTDLNTYGSNGYDSSHGYVCSNEEIDCNGGTITWTPANATTQLNADGKTFASLGTSSTEYNIPKSLNVGDWYYAGYDGTNLLTSTTVNYLTSTNRVTDNGVTTVNDGNGVDYFSDHPFTGTGTSNNGTHGHVGNYYNWSASVASNDTSSYASSTYSSISSNPQNSICPAGWRLPTITSASPTYSNEGSANEFARLVYLYNGNSYVTNSSAKLEKSPLFFARGGLVYGSSLGNSGNRARYWSSTVNSGSSAYYLNFIATYVYPAYNNYRYYGFSVRCLAR